jgi:hypothetical protein
MSTITPGTSVRARARDGELLDRRAITGVVAGGDFPVVWVCRDEEWRTAQDEGREPEGLPWPAEDVQPAEPAHAYYVILDSTANLVDSFDREDEARTALEAIVRQDPDAADHYAIVTYDDAGHPVGEAVTGADLGVHA